MKYYFNNSFKGKGCCFGKLHARFVFCCFCNDWMTCSRLFFIPITLENLAWPTTTRAYEPKALQALVDAPATYWAHQSVFVSLLSHCIICTKGPATHTPQSCYAQCWHSQNSFTPSRCPPLWSPFIPPPHPLLLDFHHPRQHAACSSCDWWLVPSPSLTFPFIPSNLGRVSLSFLLFLVLHRIPLSAHSG